MKRIRKTIAFPNALHSAIDADAAKQDRPFSYVVTQKLGSFFGVGVSDTRGVAEKKNGYKTKGGKRTVPPYSTRKAA